jgi:hypothetical protein
MTRGMFFRLLGALGFGQTLTQPTPQNSGPVKPSWDGPYSDEQGGCFVTTHTPFALMRVPCKEGEEYCPLGHSQKAELGPVFVLESDPNMQNAARSKALTHYCAVCGIVYVPIDGKP